jgi:hypothetical protein
METIKAVVGDGEIFEPSARAHEIVAFGSGGVSQSVPASVPGPGYIWIEGSYDEFGNWHEGYWALPPYVGAYWVTPRFIGGHFYAGY